MSDEPHLVLTVEGVTANGWPFPGPVTVQVPFTDDLARTIIGHAVQVHGDAVVAEALGLTEEVRQALDAVVGREAERLEREVQRLLTGDDVRVSVVANAIGFSIFAADGRPVTVNAQGVEQVDVTDDEAERCRAAAVAVLAHLEAYGYG